MTAFAAPEGAHNISLPQAELEVKDGLVDTADVPEEVRAAVEAELVGLGLEEAKTRKETKRSGSND